MGSIQQNNHQAENSAPTTPHVASTSTTTTAAASAPRTLLNEMINFFDGMNRSGFSCEKKEALLIIVDRLKNDQDASSTPIPTELFGNSKKKVRGEVIDLLLEFIPESERKKTRGPAYLKAWFQADNLKRYFMYRSKDALVTIGVTLFGKRLSTASTFDELIELLLDAAAQNDVRNDEEELATADMGEDDSNVENRRRASQQHCQGRSQDNPSPPVIDEVITAVMKKSFMRHLKGEARDHCQMGHKLELPIGRDFLNDVNNKNKLGEEIKIVSLHKVGLVGKKKYPWAKDSIDFVACVLEHNQLKLWGIEVKSRQTVLTITKEKERMRKLRRKKYEEIEAKKVSDYFHKKDERFQLLHHAYVYNFEKVALIVGDYTGKIINATIVSFNNDFLESYGNVIEDLKDKVLDWAYDESYDVDDIIIPENIVNLCSDISTINCEEALYSNVKLWKRMFHDTSILPRPTLQRIIPRSHAKWNTGKPGSDTITKIVDDCVFTPPKTYTNYESKASGRCFSNLTTAILRLHQITTAKKDFTKYYPTLQHYRDAASHRCTHKKVLRTIHRLYQEEAKMLSNPSSKINENVSNGNNNAKRPRRSLAVRFEGKRVNDKMSYIPSKSFETPAKYKRKIIEEGRGTNIVQHRTENCSGFPFEVVDQGLKTKDQRKRCYVCQNKTRWMCIKCRFYFCMDYKETKNREEGMVYSREKKDKNSNDQITKIYGKTCFHKAHEHVFKKLITCQMIPDQSNKENVEK